MPFKRYAGKIQKTSWSSPPTLQLMMTNHSTPITLGYCTNVHPSLDFISLLESLKKNTIEIKNILKLNHSLPIGLCLNETTAKEVEQNINLLKNWLEENQISVFTINGFPQGDFHNKKVLYSVYQPDWSQKTRMEHTKRLARILSQLLPKNVTNASISTVPLGWRTLLNCNFKKACATALLKIIEYLDELYKETGTAIHLDLEPEPGAALNSAQDAVSFIKENILTVKDDAVTRRHLQLCWDTCHGSITNDSPEDTWRQLSQIGMSIGKIQISNALDINFDEMNSEQKKLSIKNLYQFHEERWLHQVIIEKNNLKIFYDNLPEALQNERHKDGRWKIHFHVPIHWKTIQGLNTTQEETIRATKFFQDNGVRHFEIETYTWPKLPNHTQNLLEGIARELQWASSLLNTPTA